MRTSHPYILAIPEPACFQRRTYLPPKARSRGNSACWDQSGAKIAYDSVALTPRYWRQIWPSEIRGQETKCCSWQDQLFNLVVQLFLHTRFSVRSLLFWGCVRVQTRLIQRLIGAESLHLTIDLSWNSCIVEPGSNTPDFLAPHAETTARPPFPWPIISNMLVRIYFSKWLRREAPEKRSRRPFRDSATSRSQASTLQSLACSSILCYPRGGCWLWAVMLDRCRVWVWA